DLGDRLLAALDAGDQRGDQAGGGRRGARGAAGPSGRPPLPGGGGDDPDPDRVRGPGGMVLRRHERRRRDRRPRQLRLERRREPDVRLDHGARQRRQLRGRHPARGARVRRGRRPRGHDGHVHQTLWVWSPETIDDIQTKAELGRYTNRGLGTTRRTPHFQDLTFVPCTLSRVPLEGYRESCNTAIEIGRRHGAKPVRLKTPITIAGMSYGALSRNAK